MRSFAERKTANQRGSVLLVHAMPKVSVVLPVFNAAHSINRSVRSILAQTLTGVELIVVDDGSTDETAAVVQGISDPRLRLLQCRHRGVAAAANTGTQQARAPIIARMDADDVAHPQRLEKQLRLLREQQHDVVGCRVRILDRAGQATQTMRRYERWINEETPASEQIMALRFVELPLVNPTIMARRGYFELGFRHSDVPEDYDLMLRAAALGMSFGKVAEVLFDWTDSSDRLTRTDPRYSDEAFARCRQIHLQAGPLSGVDQVDLWGVGQTGKPWLRWLQANGMSVRHAYDIDRRKIGRQIHGVCVADCQALPNADGTPLIIAVGAAGARPLILAHIKPRNYVPGRDAWFVA